MSASRFAFGTNECHGEKCPSLAAGIDPTEMYDTDPWYARIADQYDVYVALELFEMCGGEIDDLNDAAIHVDLRDRGFDEGVVPDHIAKRCWRQAWEAQNADEQGLTVAGQLGWDE